MLTILIDEPIKEYKYCTCKDIIRAVESVNISKSPKKWRLSVKHIIYADKSIYPLITMIFNAMCKHEYLPESFMSTTITPIIKDKKRWYNMLLKLQTNCNSLNAFQDHGKMLT